LLLFHGMLFGTKLWSTDTYPDTGHDTATDTPTWIIIWENDIIQCNHRCRVGVKHRCVSNIGTPLIRGVSVFIGTKYRQIVALVVLWHCTISKLTNCLFFFFLFQSAIDNTGIWCKRSMAIMLSVENYLFLPGLAHQEWLTICFYLGWLTRGCWLSGWLATEGGSSNQECTNRAWAILILVGWLA